VKEILKKLNELIGICEVRVAKTDAQREKNLRDKLSLDKKHKQLENENKLVVEGIERLNDLKAKHEDLANAKNTKKELDLEIKRYKALQDVLEEERKELKKEKEEALAAFEDKKAKLNKDIEILKVKEKEFKIKVMDSISKELKQKGIKL